MQAAVSIIDTAYDIMMAASVGTLRGGADLFGIAYEDTSITINPYSAPASRMSETLVHDAHEDMVAPSAFHGAMHGKHTVMYAMSHETHLYKNPTIAFDSSVAVVPYGALVLVIEPQGRFYHVMWNTHEGWVLKDDLADRASKVYPEFIHGQENSVDHPNTARVRALIGDEFGLTHSEFPLQAGEYVLYKLLRRGVHIPWPDTRPRMPGSWHKILRGISGVHMGVMPKVGSILEYLEDNDMGHLAYVEAVFPDGTITVSEANYPHGGIFSERALTKDVWRSMKPVFIEIEAEHTQ